MNYIVFENYRVNEWRRFKKYDLFDLLIFELGKINLKSGIEGSVFF